MVAQFAQKVGPVEAMTEKKCRCSCLERKNHPAGCFEHSESNPNPLEAQEDRRNLDSGYAWFILLIMFLLQSSISGASRVYGIVYAKEVSTGYYDREQASWPIASASAVENLAGILTPALASFLSWRQIELLSTSLFICANLLAYFSSSLLVDILALGLVQGLALSSCTVLSLAINNDYFERFRTTAYGIQMSGSTFGVLYLSPLVSWLLADYEDFRVVYLALALVFCANIFLVLFIKPRAKTINDGGSQMKAVSELLAADGRQRDIGSVKKFRESLDSEQRKLADSGNQPYGPLARKRSRFEAHFERKNSIASISYEARSRRQSVYSGRRISVRLEPSSNLIYTLDGTPSSTRGGTTGHWPLASPTDRNTIIKSKSGVELCGNLSGRTPGEGADSKLASAADGELPARRQRISLNQARSPMIVEAGHQMSGLSHEPRLKAKLSVTNNALESPDNHLRRSPIDGLLNASGGAETTCDLNGGAVSNFNGWKLGSNNTSTLDVTDLESGAPEPHDLSSSLATVLHNQQQAYLATGQCEKLTRGAHVEPSEMDERRFSARQALKLLRLPYLHCTWLMLALYYLIARVILIILVDFAIDHGCDITKATMLLNYWSLGELVGRVVLGSIIDLQYMSCKNCIVLTCTLLAAFISCMVMVESYIVYAACSMCIAALISLEYMLINVLMVEYIGKEHVTNCYSLAACISSLVLFARPTLIGLFRDHLGSYDGLLILLASLPLLLAIVFHAFEPMLVRRWPKRQMDQG